MCIEQGCAGLRDGANSELYHEKEYEAEMNEQQIQEKETEQGAEPRAIRIRNAHVHNLKNIDVDIPLHKIVGIAGGVGLGKIFSGAGGIVCGGFPAVSGGAVHLHETADDPGGESPGG